MSEPHGSRRIVADLLEIARIPAPTFAEEPRIAWLVQRLERERSRLRRDAVGNLVWSSGSQRPKLLLLAHVDTVFPTETPLHFTERAGFLVGPGIGDNAVAVAVAVAVVESLGVNDPDAPWAVAFTVEEEGAGNLRGALAACAELRPEVAVAVEGHGLDSVFVDAVGSVRAALSVKGPGGHSWWDRDRPSAIHALIDVLQDIVRLETAETAVNVGLVAGGHSVNSIANEATASVEARSLAESGLDAFAAHIAGVRVELPLKVEVSTIGRRPAGRLDRDSELFRVVWRVRRELGLPLRLGDGSTDANAALWLGVPALALGCAHGRNMHAADEAIDVASISLGYAQLERVVRGVLAG